MGQVCTALQDKMKGKTWKEKQIKIITNRVFDTIKGDTSVQKDHLEFDELYIAVLHVYNEINKRLPGPHCDPPSEEKLKATIREFDLNLDGLLDRDEFLEFIKKITTDTIALVSRNLIIALVVAPTAALLSKKATEGVPGVGRAVQKIPSSVYASAVVLAVVWLQNAGVDP
ncbi:Calcium-binding EF hand family protein [Zostera marina]|uniref:Calcium-binding EF hand family protein n=1 Tax=Zostera marina TaxID=29655 RepID=A0A0K9Q0A9_ZOSMR|nr:Calcium-binding EF hand family protein [Zostera marina]